jgi:hypothetical protein
MSDKDEPALEAMKSLMSNNSLQSVPTLVCAEARIDAALRIVGEVYAANLAAMTKESDAKYATPEGCAKCALALVNAVYEEARK